MKKILSNKALSLMELIVATMLMSIVMLGVAGFSASLSRLYDSTTEGTQLATRTLAAMKMIVRDVSLAVGTNSNRGIVSTVGTADRHSLCLRHDIANTPDDFADDQWVCYFAYGSGTDGSLSRCVAPTGAPVVSNITQCRTGTNVLEQIVDLDTTISPTGSIFAQIIEDSGRLSSVQITLNTAQDGSASCDPAVGNICYFLETNISPVSHSRN